jgi:hypothetical protein
MDWKQQLKVFADPMKGGESVNKSLCVMNRKIADTNYLGGR